jgi:hypothetical protein
MMKYILLKDEKEEKLLLEALEVVANKRDLVYFTEDDSNLADTIWNRITDNAHERVLSA